MTDPTPDDLVAEFRSQLTAAQARIRSLEQANVILGTERDQARTAAEAVRSPAAALDQLRADVVALEGLLGRPAELREALRRLREKA